MAFTNTTAHITFGDRFAALRTQMAEAHAKRKIYRTTHGELASLNDRELSDLGLNRSMIKRIAMEAAGYV